MVATGTPFSLNARTVVKPSVSCPSLANSDRTYSTRNLTAGPASFWVAAFSSSAPTTLLPPLVRTVHPSLTSSLPILAMSSRPRLARAMKMRLFASRCVRMALKSPASPSCPDRCIWLMRYRWKRSVPAERPIAFGVERFNRSEDVRKRSRVSEMVLEELCVRRRISDSIAAIGMVRSGSFRSRSL